MFIFITVVKIIIQKCLFLRNDALYLLPLETAWDAAVHESMLVFVFIENWTN
jgi:hypothetical protein